MEKLFLLITMKIWWLSSSIVLFIVLHNTQTDNAVSTACHCEDAHTHISDQTNPTLHPSLTFAAHVSVARSLLIHGYLYARHQQPVWHQTADSNPSHQGNMASMALLLSWKGIKDTLYSSCSCISCLTDALYWALVAVAPCYCEH